MRARCLGTEGYKHSMVLRHLTHTGHTAFQNLLLAHIIHLSRMPETNAVMEAGFHFVSIKAMWKLEETFMYICIYLEKISEGLSYITQKNHCKLCKLLLLQTDYIISFFSWYISCSHDKCFLVPPSFPPTNHNFVEIKHFPLLFYISIICASWLPIVCFNPPKV